MAVEERVERRKRLQSKDREKKAKAPEQREREQRIKVNMAKEKNGGQVWMRKEELPKEEEGEMAYEEPQHNGKKKAVPKPKEKKKKSRGKKPIQQKEDVMPVKQGDPGSFIIPCSFETGITYNGLADLGAAISVMPLSMCTKVGIELLSCTNLVVQVVDGSCKRPLEIVEDVHVRVGKLVFPTDFMVLDMPEQTDVPLILGRPFLSTTEVIINMQKKVLSLGIGDRLMIFL